MTVLDKSGNDGKDHQHRTVPVAHQGTSQPLQSDPSEPSKDMSMKPDKSVVRKKYLKWD